MASEPKDAPDVDGDSSDVVTGPVGSARLVEPARAEKLGADLDQLPDLEEAAQSDPPADTTR
jgi:hypothetical protein